MVDAELFDQAGAVKHWGLDATPRKPNDGVYFGHFCLEVLGLEETCAELRARGRDRWAVLAPRARALKDRARTRAFQVSELGLIEMTRQRVQEIDAMPGSGALPLRGCSRLSRSCCRPRSSAQRSLQATQCGSGRPCGCMGV